MQRQRVLNSSPIIVTTRFSITNMVDAVIDGYRAALGAKARRNGVAARAAIRLILIAEADHDRRSPPQI